MTNQARNLDIRIHEVTELSVNEWHRLPDGQGEPEQVHLLISVSGYPDPFIMRFKAGRPMDELIVALITHRRAVFGTES